MKKFIDLLYWIYIEIKICQPHKKVEFTDLLYHFKQNINLQYLYFIFNIIKSKLKYPNDIFGPPIQTNLFTNTFRNFYRNFPKLVTEVLFTYNFVK